MDRNLLMKLGLGGLAAFSLSLPYGRRSFPLPNEILEDKDFLSDATYDSVKPRVVSFLNRAINVFENFSFNTNRYGDFFTKFRPDGSVPLHINVVVLIPPVKFPKLHIYHYSKWTQFTPNDIKNIHRVVGAIDADLRQEKGFKASIKVVPYDETSPPPQREPGVLNVYTMAFMDKAEGAAIDGLGLKDAHVTDLSVGYGDGHDVGPLILAHELGHIWMTASSPDNRHASHTEEVIYDTSRAIYYDPENNSYRFNATKFAEDKISQVLYWTMCQDRWGSNVMGAFGCERLVKYLKHAPIGDLDGSTYTSSSLDSPRWGEVEKCIMRVCVNRAYAHHYIEESANRITQRMLKELKSAVVQAHERVNAFTEKQNKAIALLLQEDIAYFGELLWKKLAATYGTFGAARVVEVAFSHSSIANAVKTITPNLQKIMQSLAFDILSRSDPHTKNNILATAASIGATMTGHEDLAMLMDSSIGTVATDLIIDLFKGNPNAFKNAQASFETKAPADAVNALISVAMTVVTTVASNAIKNRSRSNQPPDAQTQSSTQDSERIEEIDTEEVISTEQSPTVAGIPSNEELATSPLNKAAELIEPAVQATSSNTRAPQEIAVPDLPQTTLSKHTLGGTPSPAQPLAKKATAPTIPSTPPSQQKEPTESSPLTGLPSTEPKEPPQAGTVTPEAAPIKPATSQQVLDDDVIEPPATKSKPPTQPKTPAPVTGVVSRNRRNFRQSSSIPATSASRSIILPSLWKV